MVWTSSFLKDPCEESIQIRIFQRDFEIFPKTFRAKEVPTASASRSPLTPSTDR